MFSPKPLPLAERVGIGLGAAASLTAFAGVWVGLAPGDPIFGVGTLLASLVVGLIALYVTTFAAMAGLKSASRLA